MGILSSRPPAYHAPVTMIAAIAVITAVTATCAFPVDASASQGASCLIRKLVGLNTLKVPHRIWQLQPADFLSPSYLAKAQRAHGRPRLIIDENVLTHPAITEPHRLVSKYLSALRITLLAGKRLILSATLIQHPRDPKVYYVDDLGAEGLARRPGQSMRFRGIQMRKGLPPEEFRKSKDTVFGMIRELGGHEVRAMGGENYLATLLYRRVVGMAPVDPVSARVFAMLDRYQELCRTSADPIFRTTSVDQFSRRLGDFSRSVLRGSYRKAWQRIRDTGVVPSGIHALRDRRGEIVGLGFPIWGSPEIDVFFVDRSDPSRLPALTDWTDLVRRYRLELGRPVADLR